jgi:hypothetical protein
MRALDEAPLAPILCSIPNAAGAIGRGIGAIYELIGRGKIKAVKSDGRTLVVVASLHEYAATLDPAKIAPPRERKPQRLRQGDNEAENQTAE